MHLRKGSLVSTVVGLIAVVIAISIGIAVMAMFNNQASNIISQTNDTQAQNAYSQTTNIGWSAMSLLAIGILVAVGFTIIRLMQGG